jgi:hypothetical protein
MRTVRALVAACLLLVSGCAASDTTTPSLDPRQGKTTLDATGSRASDDKVIARDPADSEDSN